MTILQAFVLGIVQGLTEFLPISSTGHLVLVPWLFGWEFEPKPAFIFDVLVQWGTLLAVIAYFRRDVISLLRAAVRSLKNKRFFDEPDARLAWLILIASLPAAFAGLLLKPIVESMISNAMAVFAFLLFNAGLLLVGEHIGKRHRRLSDANVGDALLVGFMQIPALLPGISRSGSTISGGLICNLERREAARFSFLMSIPIMIGAGLIALVDLIAYLEDVSELVPLVIGFLMAAVVGYLAIRWLLGYLAHRSLVIFAIYCALIGASGLLYGVLHG